MAFVWSTVEGTVYSIVYNEVYIIFYCIVYSTENNTGHSLVLGTVYRRQGRKQVNPKEKAISASHFEVSVQSIIQSSVYYSVQYSVQYSIQCSVHYNIGMWGVQELMVS